MTRPSLVILSMIAAVSACASSSRGEPPAVSTSAPPSVAVVAASVVADAPPAAPPTVEAERAPPPPDSDGDGVADADDWCVDRPETINGLADEDGCPDSAAAAANDDCHGFFFLSGLRGTYFDTAGPGPLTEEALARATALAPRRRVQLDPALRTFRCTPTLPVLLTGHSDAREGDRCAERQAISLARAAVVRDYFIEQGIAAGRITIEGLGDNEPIASNASPRERAKNRRVEVWPGATVATRQ